MATEYEAATQELAVFDRGHRTRLVVKGRAPGKMLAGVLTGFMPPAPSALEEGVWGGRFTYHAVLTPKGKMVSDLWATLLGDEAEVGYLLDVPAAGREGLLASFTTAQERTSISRDQLAAFARELAGLSDGSGVLGIAVGRRSVGLVRAWFLVISANGNGLLGYGFEPCLQFVVGWVGIQLDGRPIPLSQLLGPHHGHHGVLTGGGGGVDLQLPQLFVDRRVVLGHGIDRLLGQVGVGIPGHYELPE